LGQFYKDVKSLMDIHTPNALLVLHNAFMNEDLGFWDDLFEDNFENVVLDFHYYQAWSRGINTTDQYCKGYEDAASKA